MTAVSAPQLEFQRAIQIFGSQQKLVDAIGNLCSQSAVSRMALGEVPISPAVAKAVESATDYQVRRWALRPDIWDPPQVLSGRAHARTNARDSREGDGRMSRPGSADRG